MADVTAVTVTLNGLPWIEQCLESLAGTSTVVVDNGSTDGTVAFVRGADYHIDWVGADGTKSSSGKVPYEWQRLDDEGKAALLDSTRKEMEAARERVQAQLAAGGPMTMNPAGGAAAAAGFEVGVRMAVTAGAAGGAPPARGGGDGRGGAAGANQRIELPPINLVNADELPDYRPAFTAGASRGDFDGNLWVRTTSPVGNAGPIYYIINAKSEVIDRVQLPESRQLVGFGKNGDVFLAVRDAEGNVRLERAKIRAVAGM